MCVYVNDTWLCVKISYYDSIVSSLKMQTYEYSVK